MVKAMMGVGGGLQPQVYTPLRDEVLHTLRQALLGGSFVVGERIIEADLAERLGVSRGTLREAIRHLEEEGLVVTSPHRGTFVVDPSHDEIRDIYGLRMALESYAAEQAARRITPTELDALQSVADDFNALASTGRAALAPRLGLDLQFHQSICEAGGNPRLLRTWIGLCAPLRLLLSAYVEPYMNSGEVVDQHQHVIDALRAGDGAAARAILIDHLIDSRDSMLETITKRATSANTPGSLRA